MTLLALVSLTLVIVSLATSHSDSATAIETGSLPKRTYGERLAGDASLAKYYNDGRLPVHLKPIHYRIRLMPFITPGNFTTAGELEVTVACLEPSYNVTLNSKDINIDGDSVRVLEEVEQNFERQVPLAISDASINKSNDQDYIIITKEELKSGANYKVQLRFVGNLNDILQGFYRSSYVDTLSGEKRWLAVTQFSPVDARRAYPCFDEPSFKATFQVSIARTLNMTSHANMPLEKSEPIEGMPGWVWDHYPNTVRMSTYLTAFLVSDFETLGKSIDSEDATEKGSVEFNVWSRRDALNQTKYARQIGPLILHHYEDYFGILFPLPKLDMVAIPDFGFSAMENWGLITYRESAMLFDPNESTTSSKQNIALVIGHELAHQWFGNLVTPAWWDDLWLKEGFASYVEYIGVNHVEPTWKILDQFPLNEIQDVFFLDALESSHPISVKVDHPDQIRQIFDRISYGKGASIIRMMNHFLGEKTFRAGLNSYLTKHGYGNAVQDDLWESLTAQAHLDGSLPADMTVKEVMDTWTLQTGYPVVTVVRDYINGNASISQDRFMLFRKDKNEKMNSTFWWVPITFTSKDNPDFGNTHPSLWMNPDEEQPVTLNDMPSSENWILLNIQETGFYRVNYDHKNWRLLTEQLQQQSITNNIIIPPSTRSQLLDDALNFARSGLIPYSIALDLCTTLKNDTDYLPWESTFRAFKHINRMLTGTSIYPRFKEILLDLSRLLVKTVGWTDNAKEKDHIKSLSRVSALQWACKLDEEKCVTEAKNLFEQWMTQSENKGKSETQTVTHDDGFQISPDLRGVVYCTGIKHGSTKEWEFTWQRYLASNVGTERNVLLDSLGCTKQLPLLKRYLGWILDSSSGIRKQDGSRVFMAVASNPLGSSLAFDFLRNNWKQLLEYYGLAFSRVASMVTASTSYMNTPEQLSQVIISRMQRNVMKKPLKPMYPLPRILKLKLKQFMKDEEGNLGTTERSFKQSIENVEANVQWMERSYEEVRIWLSNH